MKAIDTELVEVPVEILRGALVYGQRKQVKPSIYEIILRNFMHLNYDFEIFQYLNTRKTFRRFRLA